MRLTSGSELYVFGSVMFLQNGSADRCGSVVPLLLQGRLPVKWMAPEALFDRVYTHQSDV